MRSVKRIIAALFIVIVCVSSFSGCKKTVSFKTGNSAKNDYDEFITVDIFCSQANYQGIQAGWFGNVIKDRFNMEINIIAPNVSGGGDKLFYTRAAAGNIGDIAMITANGGRLKDSVAAGLLLDMSDYSDIMTHAMQYESGIRKLQTLIDDDNGIYALPSSVSSYSATEPSEGTEPTFGPYLRWDLYTQIGAPEISTLEDLLPVLKQMQDAYPETEAGQKVYAFSLFKDWDGNLMVMAKQPACLYGYDEIGFVLSKADGTDDQDIMDSDSQYVRVLKFYYEANRLGLVDPESTYQNWAAVWDKYAEGAVLYSHWPWLGQAAFNTNENLNAGKGFMLAPLKDMTIFSYGAIPSGDPYVVGIGSKTQDPERMAAFIDWLYAPEGIMMSTSQTGSTCGPEGLTWEMVDGQPYLTEFGIQAMLEGGAEVPDSWGGGSWNDGVSQLNFKTVFSKDINSETGFSYDFRYWDSYIEFTSTPVHKSWQELMNAQSTFDYLFEHNQVLVAPGSDYITPDEPSDITSLRAKCRSVIVDYSWDIIMAKTDEEFYYLLEKMQDTVKELGYDRVLAYDMELAAQQNAARDEARNN